MMKALQRAWVDRWGHNVGIAFDAVYEVSPLIRVSLPSQAAAWQLLDRWCRQVIRPNNDIRQHPLERLLRVEGISKRVLLLPQRQGSCSLNGVTFFKICPSFCQVSIHSRSSIGRRCSSKLHRSGGIDRRWLPHPCYCERKKSRYYLD